VDELKKHLFRTGRKLLKFFHKNKDRVTLNAEQVRFFLILAVLVFIGGFLISNYVLPQLSLWQQLQTEYAIIISESEILEEERETVMELQELMDDSFDELSNVTQEVPRIEPSDLLVYLSLQPANLSLFELKKPVEEEPFIKKPIDIVMWGDYSDIESTLEDIERMASVEINNFWLTPGAGFGSELGSGRGSAIGWMPGERSKSVGFLEELQNEKNETAMVRFELSLVELDESKLLRLADTPAYIQGRVNPLKSPIRVFQLSSEMTVENVEDFTPLEQSSTPAEPGVNPTRPHEEGYRPQITPTPAIPD
jgi:Tfp pilus assembly protein PilO